MHASISLYDIQIELCYDRLVNHRSVKLCARICMLTGTYIFNSDMMHELNPIYNIETRISLYTMPLSRLLT